MTQTPTVLTLFTVGHSTHPIELFVRLLQLHRIDAVADVRTSPFSRFNPQYNRDHLAQVLRQSGIQYVFLGEELGARRSERECYVGSKVDYSRVAQLSSFHKGLERLKNGASKMRIAIMCAEKDPLTCHRTILVAKEAKAYFPQILHILADGSLETQEEAEDRLLAAYRVHHPDLFVSREEQLSKAYQLRAQEIAYEESVDNSAYSP